VVDFIINELEIFIAKKVFVNFLFVGEILQNII